MSLLYSKYEVFKVVLFAVMYCVLLFMLY